MDKPELKPCPFCGGEPEITEVIDRTPRNLEPVGFGVKCDQCGIIVAKIDCGVTDWFETDEEAAAAWNRRAEQTGEWLEDEYGYCRCSRCGYEHDQPETTTPYCPECGARMGGMTEVTED